MAKVRIVKLHKTVIVKPNFLHTISRQHLEWRKQVNFDTADTWEIPEIMINGFPYFLDGVDKDGRSGQ